MVQSMLRYLVEFNFDLQQRLVYVPGDKNTLGTWLLKALGISHRQSPRFASEEETEKDSLLG